MFPFVTAARFKIFVACFVLPLFIFAAMCRFNRHCPICYAPVSIEYGLTLGILACVGDHKKVHKECLGALGGNSELQNSFGLH